MHACGHAPQTPWQSPTLIHPPTPPREDPWNQSEVNKNLTNQDISILFEDFNFVETPPPTHNHIHTHPTPPTAIGGPPNLLKHDKTLTNQDISILFEDLKFVNHPTPHPPTPTPTPTYPTHPQERDTQINWNLIKLERIKIFQFCLKIWNLWRLPHLWVGVYFGGWVGRWMGGLMGGIMSNH